MENQRESKVETRDSALTTKCKSKYCELLNFEKEKGKKNAEPRCVRCSFKFQMVFNNNRSNSQTLLCHLTFSFIVFSFMCFMWKYVWLFHHCLVQQFSVNFVCFFFFFVAHLLFSAFISIQLICSCSAFTSY